MPVVDVGFLVARLFVAVACIFDWLLPSSVLVLLFVLDTVVYVGCYSCVHHPHVGYRLDHWIIALHLSVVDGTQVVILFAGVKGFIDRVDVNKVTAYEKAWLAHIKASHSVSPRTKRSRVVRVNPPILVLFTRGRSFKRCIPSERLFGESLDLAPV